VNAIFSRSLAELLPLPAAAVMKTGLPLGSTKIVVVEPLACWYPSVDARGNFDLAVIGAQGVPGEHLVRAAILVRQETFVKI
jgi:hypothetical protein